MHNQSALVDIETAVSIRSPDRKQPCWVKEQRKTRMLSTTTFLPTQLQRRTHTHSCAFPILTPRARSKANPISIFRFGKKFKARVIHQLFMIDARNQVYVTTGRNRGIGTDRKPISRGREDVRSNSEILLFREEK